VHVFFSDPNMSRECMRVEEIEATQRTRRYFYITSYFLQQQEEQQNPALSLTYATRALLVAVDSKSFEPSFEAFDELVRQAKDDERAIPVHAVSVGMHALELTREQYNQLLTNPYRVFHATVPAKQTTRPAVAYLMSLCLSPPFEMKRK